MSSSFCQRGFAKQCLPQAGRSPGTLLRHDQGAQGAPCQGEVGREPSPGQGCRAPAPRWHPRAHPLPSPMSQPGNVAPSAGYRENHVPGCSTAAPSSALPGTHPAPHRDPASVCEGARELRRQPRPRQHVPWLCRAEARSRPFTPHPSTQGRAGTQGWGSTGDWQGFPCSAAPGRACHRTSAWLRLHGMDVHLLEESEERWRGCPSTRLPTLPGSVSSGEELRQTPVPPSDRSTSLSKAPADSEPLWPSHPSQGAVPRPHSIGDEPSQA